MANLRVETLAFAQTAPKKIVFEADLEAPPERVFAIFADNNSWPKWFRDMKKAEWLPGPSACVGAHRKVTLKTLVAEETFLAWEPGKRYAFALSKASLPLVRALVEVIDFTPTPTGTHLVWTVGYEPSTITAIFHPLIKSFFAGQWVRALENLKIFVRV